MLKLRPGTHFSPAPAGVLVAGRGEPFVLRGPRGLYDLLDGNLGHLLDGTEPSALAEAVGDPRAEAVFAHLFATLLERGVLFDVAAHPAPSPLDASRFAGTLAYCEATCAQPYEAFARLRAARVGVVATTADVPATLHRSLRDAGVGPVDDPAQAEAVVVVRGADSAWPSLRTDAAVLPVRIDAGTVVVGPWSPAGPDVAWTDAVAERAAGWVELDPSQAAPPAVAAALGGSLAARSVLDRLLGVDPGEGSAVIVHGARPRTTTVPVPTAAGRPDALTAILRGPLRRDTDEDLPQLPMAVARAEVVGLPADRRHVLGWGTDRDGAHHEVLLAGLRRRAAAVSGDGGGAGSIAGAGASAERAELDGRLRLLARSIGAGSGDGTAGTPGEELAWEQVDASRPRALWSLLEDHYGRRIEVRVHRPADTSDTDGWVLVAVTDRTPDAAGRTHRQWGSTVEAAVFAALGAMVVDRQLAPGDGSAGDTDTAGTQHLARVSDAAVRRALEATGRTGGWRYVPVPADPVVGPLPLHVGTVTRR